VKGIRFQSDIESDKEEEEGDGDEESRRRKAICLPA
jgi:hypothetical protein